jgi:hypothetical protein
MNLSELISLRDKIEQKIQILLKKINYFPQKINNFYNNIKINNIYNDFDFNILFNFNQETYNYNTEETEIQNEELVSTFQNIFIENNINYNDLLNTIKNDKFFIKGSKATNYLAEYKIKTNSESQYISDYKFIYENIGVWSDYDFGWDIQILNNDKIVLMNYYCYIIIHNLINLIYEIQNNLEINDDFKEINNIINNLETQNIIKKKRHRIQKYIHNNNDIVNSYHYFFNDEENNNLNTSIFKISIDQVNTFKKDMLTNPLCRILIDYSYNFNNINIDIPILDNDKQKYIKEKHPFKIEIFDLVLKFVNELEKEPMIIKLPNNNDLYTTSFFYMDQDIHKMFIEIEEGATKRLTKIDKDLNRKSIIDIFLNKLNLSELSIIKTYENIESQSPLSKYKFNIREDIYNYIHDLIFIVNQNQNYIELYNFINEYKEYLPTWYLLFFIHSNELPNKYFNNFMEYLLYTKQFVYDYLNQINILDFENLNLEENMFYDFYNSFNNNNLDILNIIIREISNKIILTYNNDIINIFIDIINNVYNDFNLNLNLSYKIGGSLGEQIFLEDNIKSLGYTPDVDIFIVNYIENDNKYFIPIYDNDINQINNIIFGMENVLNINENDINYWFKHSNKIKEKILNDMNNYINNNININKIIKNYVNNKKNYDHPYKLLYKTIYQLMDNNNLLFYLEYEKTEKDSEQFFFPRIISLKCNYNNNKIHLDHLFEFIDIFNQKDNINQIKENNVKNLLFGGEWVSLLFSENKILNNLNILNKFGYYGLIELYNLDLNLFNDIDINILDKIITNLINNEFNEIYYNFLFMIDRFYLHCKRIRTTHTENEFTMKKYKLYNNIISYYTLIHKEYIIQKNNYLFPILQNIQTIFKNYLDNYFYINKEEINFNRIPYNLMKLNIENNNILENRLLYFDVLNDENKNYRKFSIQDFLLG